MLLYVKTLVRIKATVLRKVIEKKLFMTGRRPQVSILGFIFRWKLLRHLSEQWAARFYIVWKIQWYSDCPLGETDAHREEGRCKLDDIEDTLRGGFKQCRGDVNRWRCWNFNSLSRSISQAHSYKIHTWIIVVNRVTGSKDNIDEDALNKELDERLNNRLYHVK